MIFLVLLGCVLQTVLSCSCGGPNPYNLQRDICRHPTMNVIKAKVGKVDDWVHNEFNITVSATIEKVWGLGEARVGDIVEITGPRNVRRSTSTPAPFDYFIELSSSSCDTEEMAEGQSVLLWWNGSGQLRRFFCDVLYFQLAPEDYVDRASSNANC